MESKNLSKNNKKINNIKNKENEKSDLMSTKNTSFQYNSNNIHQKPQDSIEFDYNEIDNKVLDHIESLDIKEQQKTVDSLITANLEQNFVTIGDLSDELDDEVGGTYKNDIPKNDCINTPKSLNIRSIDKISSSTDDESLSDSANESENNFMYKNLLNKSLTSPSSCRKTNKKLNNLKKNENNNKVKARIPLKPDNKQQAKNLNYLKKRGRPPKSKDVPDYQFNGNIGNQNDEECDNNIYSTENVLNTSSNETAYINQVKKSRGRPKKNFSLTASLNNSINKTEMDEKTENLNSSKRKYVEKMKKSKRLLGHNNENNEKMKPTDYDLNHENQHITIASLTNSPKRKRGRPSKCTSPRNVNSITNCSELNEKISIAKNDDDIKIIIEDKEEQFIANLENEDDNDDEGSIVA